MICQRSESSSIDEKVLIYEKSGDLPATFDEIVSAIIIKTCGSIDLDRFDGLTNLHQLNITRNNISLKGSEFSSLSSLEVLNLKLNGIKEIPVKQFSGLTKLREVYLDENQISSIDKKTFAENVELKIVSLSSNDIAELHYKTFASLTSLVELDLSLNRLTSLRMKLFERNGKLEQLHLIDNHLKFVESNIFESLTSLARADFEGNPCVSDWIIPTDIKKLNETINESCKVDKDTELRWLREEIADLQEENAELRSSNRQPTVKSGADEDSSKVIEELNISLNICQEKLLLRS